MDLNQAMGVETTLWLLAIALITITLRRRNLRGRFGMQYFILSPRLTLQRRP